MSGDIHTIGVIGVGGVGGYFGGKLCRLSAADPDVRVYFVARGAHLAAIQQDGLLLSTHEGESICRPTLATDRLADLPLLDLCLVCVKAYDLAGLLVLLEGVVSAQTLIVPLLNGVDIYERIRVVISSASILPACVYIGTHIERPGKVVQKGGAGEIVLGPDPHRLGCAPQALRELFDSSSIKHRWLDDPYPAIWEKFVFIAAFGLVTACFDRTLGQVMDSNELSQHVLGIMREIAELAGKRGVALPETIVEDAFAKGRNFPPETRTSFQRDFAQVGKPDERDLFGGTLVRLGQASGVPVPATRFVYDQLQKLKPLAPA
ncbi:MAG: 2-dehydropantoate 2-reductase [Thermoflexales bacterium]|nr:2-dehydropantoate 2-reductase [Thermoflexales bacterium]